jgi:hypothetical protein
MENQPDFVDHAAPILAASPYVNDDERADLHDVFHNSKDHNELARQLQTIAVPDDLKHQLFAAKKLQSPEPAPIDKATEAIQRVGQIDPKILELAEKYPNVTKILAAAASEKGKDAGKAEPKGKDQSTEKKEPTVAPDVPATPAKHALVRASDGSLHHIPAENLDKAREIDPKLTVLHVEP